MPQQFNPVLPSPIRMSGFIWPQVSVSQLWLCTLILLNRLGFGRNLHLPQSIHFDFCITKPALESGSRREGFSLSFRSAINHETVFLTPQAVWLSPIAAFLWVKHQTSCTSLLVCFPTAHASNYRHFCSWVRFYKIPGTQKQFDGTLPLFGGLQ